MSGAAPLRLSHAFAAQFQGIEFNLSSSLALLRRRGVLMLVVLAGTLLLAIIFLLLTPPQYTAQALLQINTRHEQVTNLADIMGGETGTSDAALRSEIDVLRSRKLAARVIEKLHLLNNAELSGMGPFTGLKLALRYFLFPANPVALPTAEARLTIATNALLKRLSIDMQPRSYSISVGYTSHNPQLAAQVAGAVALEYLNSQLEDRFDATRRATDWMAARLKELRGDVYSAELAVQKFRESHNLTQAKGVTLTEQQLSELNSQLILARTQQAETEAKLTQADQMASSGRGIETTSEVLNSPLIQNLREQETEVRRKLSDLSARYGQKHPRYQTVRNELADVQRKIAEETLKIKGSLANDVAVAKARVDTLQNQLEDLQQQTSASSSDEVQLAELERQAEAERNLYQNFLARSKEIAQMDLAQTDARIIDPAELPLAPSKPNKPLALALATLLGLLLGGGLALLLETLDNGFRTTDQLQKATGLPTLGQLAELAGDNLATYVRRKPTAAFTEALRAIRTAMGNAYDSANPRQAAQIILVSSSIPGEGKTLFSLSLAQLAANAGQKVLLLEADLRRPTLAKQLSLKPKTGLAEILSGKTTADKTILQTGNIHVLPALGQNQFAQELLGGAPMKTLLAAQCKQYDLIILDSPPLMAVADALTLAKLADSVLFMVRWGSTPRPAVVAAIASLNAAKAPLAGCVLTRLDPARQHTYGGYYANKYTDYYTN